MDAEVFFLANDWFEITEVDGVLVAAIEFDPFAHGVKEGGFVFGEGAGGCGAEVHEEVCAGGPGSAEVFDDRGGADHVEVVGGGSPVVVAGHAHFAGVVFVAGSDFWAFGVSAFEGDGVYFWVGEFAFFADAGVVDDEGVGLVFANGGVELIEFPIGFGF